MRTMDLKVEMKAEEGVEAPLLSGLVLPSSVFIIFKARQRVKFRSVAAPVDIRRRAHSNSPSSSSFSPSGSFAPFFFSSLISSSSSFERHSRFTNNDKAV